MTLGLWAVMQPIFDFESAVQLASDFGICVNCHLNPSGGILTSRLSPLDCGIIASRLQAVGSWPVEFGARYQFAFDVQKCPIRHHICEMVLSWCPFWMALASMGGGHWKVMLDSERRLLLQKPGDDNQKVPQPKKLAARLYKDVPIIRIVG